MHRARSSLVLSAVIALSCTTLAAAGPPVSDTWTAPRNQSSPSATAATPFTVMSADGQRIVQAWHLDSDKIQVTRTTDGGQTWTDPVDLPMGAGAGLEDLAASRDGMHLVLVSRRFTGVDNQVSITRSHDGGATWTGPTFLTNPGSLTARAAISSDGQTILLVWTQTVSGTTRVYARVSPNGGTSWRDAELLSAVGFNSATPDVAMSATGTNAVVVWTRSGGGQASVIQSNRTADGGVTWASSSTLSTDGDIPHNPQVVLSTDGVRAATVWSRDTGVGRIRLAKSKSGGQVWESPITVSLSSLVESAPAIAASDNGMVINLVWQMSTLTYTKIANTCTQDWGSNWITQQVLSQKDVPATGPAIATSASGQRVTAAWTAYSNSNFRTQTVTSVDGCVSWTPHRFLSDPGWDSLLHNLVVSANGLRTAAAWTRYDGVNDRLQIARGSITTIPGAPENPQATPSDGSATVSWSAPGDDGGAAVSSYTVTASPGGQTCTSGATQCAVGGLTNGAAYTFSVTATNSMGTGPSSVSSAAVTPQASPQPAPTPTPTPTPDIPTKATVKATGGKSKLLVTIAPDRGPTTQWRFTVQRKRGKTWRTIGKARSTKGPKHRKVIDLPRGSYRVVVAPVAGYTGSTSKVVRLAR